MLTIFLADEVSRRTTLSKDGLTAGTRVRRRSCRWDEVVSIEARTVNSRSGTPFTRIVVECETRRPIKLNMPAGAADSADARFQEDLNRIRTYWKQHSPR